VPVELVVRGICALRPGVEGFSENIVVRSILGRFLEHSRIIECRAIDEFWIGSADMMHRNLDRRVEVMVQVKDPRLCAQLNDVFDSAMDPATRCWELRPDRQWIAAPQDGATVRDHQVSLMERHRNP
jgi:polyphosphate kinase